MTRRCAGSLWVVEWGDTYDHSLAGVRGRPADRTLMVEPDSAEPIRRDIAVSVGAITNVGKPLGNAVPPARSKPPRFTPTVHEMTILRVLLFGFRFTDV